MSKKDEIYNELIILYEYGRGLHLAVMKEKFGTSVLPTLIIQYEAWYTKALSAIQQIIPGRHADFICAYKVGSRKEINAENYGILDFLKGISVGSSRGKIFDEEEVYSIRLASQLGILKAAIDSFSSKVMDIRAELQSEILDLDLGGAKELLKAKHVRPAGIIAGVVLEAHLKSVCNRKNIRIYKKNNNISDFNDLLKKSEVYDTPRWRFIQGLSDIRNLCAHSKDREPNSDEVEDLIAGVQRVIKEVF